VEEFYQRRLPKAAPFIHMEEGSGLSRKNTVTPVAMLAVLDTFHPFADLLQEKDGHRIKTGTLEGVYSLAGYLSSGNGLESFVIILNQRKNTRDAVFARLQRSRLRQERHP
jgi:D-alanyl-D-alanine carboxypeptidase